MTKDVLEQAARLAEQGTSFVLVTVAQTKGSSPASPGQMMVVDAEGIRAGTVGGGLSEHKLMQRALQAMENSEQTFAFAFDHAEDGMSCGGGMSGYGTLVGTGIKLYIFGGGHIAQSLAPLCAKAGFIVTVVEDRDEFQRFFEGVAYVACAPDEYEKRLPGAGGYAVICTRGHRTDDDALRFCMGRHFDYIGMIGSRNKVKSMFEGLRADGVADETLDKIYAPIGLDIASGAPFEIAIAVLAEILLIKNNGSPQHKKLSYTNP